MRSDRQKSNWMQEENDSSGSSKLQPKSSIGITQTPPIHIGHLFRKLGLPCAIKFDMFQSASSVWNIKLCNLLHLLHVSSQSYVERLKFNWTTDRLRVFSSTFLSGRNQHNEGAISEKPP
jgi:hypothetical protein